MKKIYLRFCFLTLFFGISISQAQIQNFESKANEIDRLVEEHKNLSREIEKKFSKLRAKSDEIAKIKSKNSVNLLSNRKLQNLLSDSKALADQLDSLEEKNNKLKKLIEDKSAELIASIDNSLIEVFRKTKSLERHSNSYKEGLKKLTRLYHMRSAYSPHIKESKYSIRLIPIEFSKNETDQSLKNKLTLLQDQEDYLASISAIIEDEIRRSEEWNNLTDMAGDLIEDLQVQQSQDEALAKSASSNASMKAQSAESGLLTERNDLFDNKLNPTNEIIIPINFENIYQLDRSQLQQQIKTLQQFQTIIKTKVDSLSNIIKTKR